MYVWSTRSVNIRQHVVCLRKCVCMCDPSSSIARSLNIKQYVVYLRICVCMCGPSLSIARSIDMLSWPIIVHRQVLRRQAAYCLS